ncbi:hypothetical protein AD929_01440 [Gluconobacter potus]|uniref:Uncharacterized protein n=1 Tax=Gluconobacter potus TaxID=2724927 RepID=A0A149QZZ9_9PROT|nr:hypothetical protein [Gluconobacter potus]KXV02899.1 hypothetical protein AD929_01440 [Gluconobacter potus]
MTGDLAGFRIGIAELAILGLLFPAECDDLSVWSGEERAIFRRAADLVACKGDDLLVPPGDGQDALAAAQWEANVREPGWWPFTWVKTGPDGACCRQVHDLTLPLLWGTEWLLVELERRRFAYEDPAIRAASDLIRQAKARLDVLRECESGLVNDVPDLRDACAALSDALQDRCPVLMAWPSRKAEPA